MPEGKLNSGMFSKAIVIGKDLVALLRDAALFILAVLLILFPGQFNSILVNAGFKEGSIAGFKWESKLVATDQQLKNTSDRITALQEENNKLLAALRDANSKANDPELLRRYEELNAASKRQEQQTEKIQRDVSITLKSNQPFVEKARASSDQKTVSRALSDYSVGLQLLGADDADRLALNEKLATQGYSLDSQSGTYSPRPRPPAWFALQSTVLYYSPLSSDAAGQLAVFMKATTGQNFAVKKGSGYGVDPARRDVTLFVHYIKP